MADSVQYNYLLTTEALEFRMIIHRPTTRNLIWKDVHPMLTTDIVAEIEGHGTPRRNKIVRRVLLSTTIVFQNEKLAKKHNSFESWNVGWSIYLGEFMHGFHWRVVKRMHHGEYRVHSVVYDICAGENDTCALICRKSFCVVLSNGAP